MCKPAIACSSCYATAAMHAPAAMLCVYVAPEVTKIEHIYKVCNPALACSSCYDTAARCTIARAHFRILLTSITREAPMNPQPSFVSALFPIELFSHVQ